MSQQIESGQSFIIDQNGDYIVTIGDPRQPYGVKHFCVCSQVLRLANPDAASPEQVVQPVDADPDAWHIILLILHLKAHELPTYMSAHQLDELAFVSLESKLLRLVVPYAKHMNWVGQHKEQGMLGAIEMWCYILCHFELESVYGPDLSKKLAMIMKRDRYAPHRYLYKNHGKENEQIVNEQYLGKLFDSVTISEPNAQPLTSL